MRIAVDMDEVIADTHSAKLQLFRDLGYDWSEDDMAGRKLMDMASEVDAWKVESEMHKGHFFANLDPVEGSVEALEDLSREHEVFIATAAMEYPASVSHKVAWMQRHFPFVPLLNLVLCGDKSILRADALIDDSPRHFDHFTGAGICFTASHNLGEDVPHRLDRWSDGRDLVASLA